MSWRILPDVESRIRVNEADTYEHRLALLRNRLARRADIRETDTCINWSGPLDGKGGYSRIAFEGRRIGGHRAAYLAYVRDVPESLVIDHLCRNHACVNPLHLEAVSNAENVLRGIGITARHARATHCKRGHPFTTENTYLHGGKRVCRTCHLAKVARHWRAKNKETS